MTKKIAIVVDSGSDVPQSVLDENKNIAVVPLNITMNGHNYLDAVDITPDEFYSALATGRNIAADFKSVTASCQRGDG